jgi:molybdenum cofactor cytidylyltransferase
MSPPPIRPETTALILLAAGRSVRFGDTDKLAEPYLGKPLAFHAVTAFEDMPFAFRVAVTLETHLDFGGRGYDVIVNDLPEEGQARSVRLGVAEAARRGAAAAMIALADMPRVTAAQLYRLIDDAEGDDAVVASSDGVKPSPPALFGAAHFDALKQLSGDRGARDLIARGRHVVTSPAELIDIDTPEDLAALRALARPHG